MSNPDAPTVLPDHELYDDDPIHDEDEDAEEVDPLDHAWGVPRGSHRRKVGQRKIPGDSISHLNLTPMMDIMTMLLVFLVKSFATEPTNINVNLGLRPPESSATVMMEAATKLVITSDKILVEDEEVVTLTALGDAGNKDFIPAVSDALIARADHLRALEARGGAPFDGKLLVVAHETTPYHVITSVLVTAGQATFREYKLVVMQGASD